MAFTIVMAKADTDVDSTSPPYMAELMNALDVIHLIICRIIYMHKNT